MFGICFSVSDIGAWFTVVVPNVEVPQCSGRLGLLDHLAQKRSRWHTVGLWLYTILVLGVLVD